MFFVRFVLIHDIILAMTKSSIINRLGFTLIELLVVIAIIGLLSSVVVALLNESRAKGVDAAVKDNLVQLRNEAEIYYSTQGSVYSGLFNSGTNASEIFTLAQSASGTSEGVASIAGDGQSWSAWVPLKTDVSKAWCVDSQGSSKILDSLPSGVITVCP